MRLILFVFGMLSCVYGSSQTHQKFLFNQIGTAIGLVTEETMGVAQDKQGFLWIATLDGLQRYDGRRFLTFRSNPVVANSLPNDNILTIFFDDKQRLWMRCGGNKMGYFNTANFTFHEVPVELSENKLSPADSRFVKDRQGNLCLVIMGNGVFTYDEKADIFSQKYTPFTIPPKWRPFYFVQDPLQLNYWIGCDSGLVKYDPKRKIMSTGKNNVDHDKIIDAYRQVTNVLIPFMDTKGRLWMHAWPSNEGAILYSYDPGSNQFINWEPQFHKALQGRYHEYEPFFQSSDGTVWAMGNNVFASFNENKKMFEPIISNQPGEYKIRYDQVRQIFEDREHNLWACTNKGLFRFNPSQQFCHPTPNMRPGSDSIYTPDVSDVIQTKSGEILVSTWGNGLFAYDNQFNPINSLVTKQAQQLREGLTWCMVERSNGDIWRGNQDGMLFIYHANTKTTEKIQPPALKKETVRQILEDRNGNLWFGTQGGELVKWDAGNQLFVTVKDMHSVIQRLYIDQSGILWVCCLTGGVYAFDVNTNEIRYHFTNDGPATQRLFRSNVYDIIQYNDSLYLLASGCLNLLNIKTKQISYLSSDDGYPANNVSNIIKDRHGYLWITSMSGLCSINFEKNIVTTYNERDGVHTNGFNSASTGMLKDGRIVIGTAHDMLVFDPSYLSKTAVSITPPNLTITAFTLMNKRLKLDSLLKLPVIELDYDKTSLVIEMSTLTYLNSYGIFYMMEGLDKEWKLSPNSQQAIFNSLPPGTYTFKAMCKNGDGEESKVMAELHIKVFAPFWKTWWFYLLVIMLVASLVYWIDRERMKRKESLQKMRSQIAGNLHEEINLALNNINILSEMARIKADKEPEKSKEYIEQIHSRSHNMIIAMDDMLWSLDPINDSMPKTLERIREFIDALKNRHQVHIDLSVDPKVASLPLNMKRRHEAFGLFKDGVRSIILSGASECLVHISLDKQAILFNMQFKNAGCNFSTLKGLLGRDEIERKIETTGINLKLQEQPGESVLLIRIPID